MLLVLFHLFVSITYTVLLHSVTFAEHSSVENKIVLKLKETSCGGDRQTDNYNAVSLV